MEQPPQEKEGLAPAIDIAHAHAHAHANANGNDILVNYKGVYRIDWKSHFYWALAVVFFILARLWWLVPLPGDSLLPAYRTYPANFFNTLFLGFACALATRSVTVALLKPFEEGINPDSVVAFGATGGFGAMWSCIRYRSGYRYFLLAFLVTAATLLGDALEGELQSSMKVYYRVGATTDLSLAECQHVNASDYQAASMAYSSGQISHTMSDASPLLKSHAFQPTIKPYAVSLLKTSLVSVQNISLGSTTAEATANLGKRNYHSKKCEEEELAREAAERSSSSSSSSSAVSPSATEDASISSSVPSLSPAQQQQVQQGQQQGQRLSNLTTDTILLTLDGQQTIINVTAAVFYNFDSSKLSVSKGAGNHVVAFNPTITGGSNGSSSNNGNNSGSNGNDSNGSVSNGSVSNSGVSNSNDSNGGVRNGGNESNNSNSSNSSNGSSGSSSNSGSSSTSSSSSSTSSSSSSSSSTTTTTTTFTTTTSEIKLNVFRHTTSDNKQVIIIYSPASDGYTAGVYVSATATNYTCQSQLCNSVGEHEADNKVVADALAEAIQSGVGLYGSQGLAANIINHDSMSDKGLLADALYANPNCPQSVEIPTQGNTVYPYAAARFNILSLIWILCYVIIYAIGAYLIGFSEETWSQLARTGRMIPQIISNSSNLFVDGVSGKTVNQEAFLEPSTGKMVFAKDHNHGYSVTEEVLSP